MHPVLLESVTPVAARPVDWTVEPETFPVCSHHAGCSTTEDHTEASISFLPTSSHPSPTPQPDRRTFLS